MCRLLFLRRGACRKITSLQPWLDRLVASNGGDGNGYATMKGGSVKGVGLSAEECAHAICGPLRKSNVVWHTRLISCGGKVDELCHPFGTGMGYLIHNGHWMKGAFAAKLMAGEWSDSRVAALYTRLYGWGSLCHHVDSGVWIHLIKEGVQVCYKSGSLYVELQTGSLCSEPCPLWGEWAPAQEGIYDVEDSVAPKPALNPRRLLQGRIPDRQPPIETVRWQETNGRLNLDWRDELYPRKVSSR